MNVLDVNVLVALARGDHPHHEVAAEWFQSAGQLTVSDFVATGFVRIATNPRVWKHPMTSADALEFLTALRAQPGHLTWVGQPQARDVFADLLQTSGVSGSRVSDAWIAAETKAYGATLVTFDRDFRRFDDLLTHELPIS